MKLLLKEKTFSLLRNYDIYYEDGSIAYTVKGKIAWRHKLVIYDTSGKEVGMILEKVSKLLPKLEIYIGGKLVGSLNKEFKPMHPYFDSDYNNWKVEGNWSEWDYTITNKENQTIAVIEQDLNNFTHTYVIDVMNPDNAFQVLMFVLAIDAEKASRRQ